MEDTTKHPKLNYRFSNKKNLIYIDIRIDFYREIYNVWDFSPMINRDLDDDLLEYIESSAEEIPMKYSLCIVFHLPQKIRDPDKEEKSIIGFQNYEIRKLKQQRKNNFKKSGFYFLFGLILIFIASLLRKISLPILFIDVLIEGFFIGGWVLFWELFSAIFFKQNDMRRRGKILSRLMNSKIVYHYI